MLSSVPDTTSSNRTRLRVPGVENYILGIYTGYLPRRRSSRHCQPGPTDDEDRGHTLIPTGSHVLSFRQAILGLLAKGPQHGYELKAAYETDLFPTSRLNFGQVYTTLERLSRDGLIEFEEVNQAERPDKKVYRLTTAGRAELKSWMHKPSSPTLDQRSETFLKLMLARRLKGHDVMTCLARERDACFQRLHRMTRARTQAQDDRASLQTVLLLDLATLQLEAFLKWLDRCEEELGNE